MRQFEPWPSSAAFGHVLLARSLLHQPVDEQVCFNVGLSGMAPRQEIRPRRRHDVLGRSSEASLPQVPMDERGSTEKNAGPRHCEPDDRRPIRNTHPLLGNDRSGRCRHEPVGPAGVQQFQPRHAVVIFEQPVPRPDRSRGRVTTANNRRISRSSWTACSRVGGSPASTCSESAPPDCHSVARPSGG